MRLMKRFVLLGWWVVAAILVAPASAQLLERGYSSYQPPLAPGERMLKPLTVDIKVSAQGQITQIRTEPTIPAPIAQVMSAAVKRWKFQPAKRGGQAIDSATRMTITLIAVPAEQGVTLRVSRVGLASVWITDSSRLVSPKYPMSMKRRATAQVAVLSVPDLATGQLNVIAMQVDGKPAKASDPFAEAARIAISRWKPEILEWDGVKYPEFVCVPVGFSLDPGKSEKTSEDQDEDSCKGMLDEALDDGITLKSKVVGQTL